MQVKKMMAFQYDNCKYSVSKTRNFSHLPTLC